MAIMIILGLVLIATLLYHYLVKFMTYWTDRGVQQGSSFSLFSDNWAMMAKRKKFPEIIEDIYSRCGGKRYSGAYIFFAPSLILRDPELIKQITVKDFEHFTDHRLLLSPDVEPLWAKNLFALTGKRWRDMRNILSPSFTSSKMKLMFVLISECAENFVQHFLEKHETLVELELKDTFTRFTNDVIATTAFGIKVDSLAEPNNDFYLMGKEVTNFTGFWKILKLFGNSVFPRLFKLFKVSIFGKEVTIFFETLIRDTIKTREERGIIRPDMIHLLMEARKGNILKQEETGLIDTGFATAMESDLVSGNDTYSRDITNQDIAAQALIFFFAGFDTVSVLMCLSSYELAVDQQIQKRLRKEIHETFEQCRGKLTYEALLKMKYLDMVISETLRKWPNAIATDRVCTKPYTIEPTVSDEKPLYLDKGEVLTLPIWGIHRDPQYYPDPERFDPERFNDDNKVNIKPYTYFPFGLGPRNCIGSRFALLEAKAVLFHLLLHFEIVPVKKTRIPLKLDRKTLNINAEGGFWFGLKHAKK